MRGKRRNSDPVISDIKSPSAPRYGAFILKGIFECSLRWRPVINQRALDKVALAVIVQLGLSLRAAFLLVKINEGY